MRRVVLFLLAGSLLGSSGCLFNGNESFRCDEDRDCPSGQTCDRTAHRCIGSDPVDAGGTDAGETDGGGSTDGGSTDGGGTDGGETDGGPTCVPQAGACNGADDDCDGATDETDELGTPPACTSQLGVCAGASQRCVAGGWEDCAATNYETTEASNASCDALDNDCNGVTDPGCPACQAGATQVCGQTGGVCSLGAQVCTDQNVWGSCSGVLPTAEICDNFDNDCDGETDEPADVPPLDCPLNTGVCFGAQVACAGGVLPSCISAYGIYFEVTETTCDGRDNNCDGFTDQDARGLTLERDCLKQEGVCAGAVVACAAGEFAICTDADYAAHDARYNPTTDADCDGIDNDCDGETDEDFPGTVDCHPSGNLGVCAGVTSNCLGGVETCPTPTGYEATETSCDGLDNDCDGTPDPSCNCNFGDPDQACGTDVGTCVSGTQTCLISGSWDACTGTGPSAEICDGLDNNCDGVTDDGFGIGATCSPGQGECENFGVIQCATTATTECSVQADPPVAESCDGLDNDCDGSTDEDDTTGAALTQDCSPAVGVCANVVSTCLNGDFPACDFGSGYQAIETLCDGEDNDCDGSTDVNLPAPECVLRIGVCAGSTQTCGGGSGWLACSTATYQAHSADYEPTSEISCDSLDNDCDGLTDEDGTGLPLLQVCPLTQGVCAGVNAVCSNGVWGSCNYGSNYQATELSCDGLDNDCDGLTDDADSDLSCACTGTQTEICGSNVGACQQGTRTCSGGAWGTCVGEVAPTFELCDGLDNDCDGLTDENAAGQPLTRTCALQDGVCAGSIETCAGTSGWGGCDYAEHARATNDTYEQVETLCDQRDNDCNGTVDGPIADGDCAVSTLCMVGSCGATGCTVTTQASGTSCGQGCTCAPNGVARESDCGDWVDNDADGLTDCIGESDCFGDPICVPKCGDAKCNPHVECNSCPECGLFPGCGAVGCGGTNTYCDVFGGECGRCSECSTDWRCGTNTCNGTPSCQPMRGQCSMGCPGCATNNDCMLSTCSQDFCSPLSNECTTCATALGNDDCYLDPTPCATGTCWDGRCAPETGECETCVDEGEDCDGSVLCNGFNCTDNICNPLLGECIACLDSGEDCRAFLGQPVAACHGFGQNCSYSGDNDGDGLIGCADPDCTGTTCATNCTCQNGDCVDANQNLCP